VAVVSWPAKRKILIWTTVLQTRDALGVTLLMANLSDGPSASGSFGLVVEQALHLGGDGRGELLVVDAPLLLAMKLLLFRRGIWLMTAYYS
jgi:hypothetical protein